MKLQRSDMCPGQQSSAGGRGARKHGTWPVEHATGALSG